MELKLKCKKTYQKLSLTLFIAIPVPQKLSLELRLPCGVMPRKHSKSSKTQQDRFVFPRVHNVRQMSALFPVFWQDPFVLA